MLSFFFFNDTATTEIYTFPYTTLFRSRLPHFAADQRLLDTDVRRAFGHRERILAGLPAPATHLVPAEIGGDMIEDRKSTRLNSSHLVISYAVFCLKKKTEKPCHTEHVI